VNTSRRIGAALVAATVGIGLAQPAPAMAQPHIRPNPHIPVHSAPAPDANENLSSANQFPRRTNHFPLGPNHFPGGTNQFPQGNDPFPRDPNETPRGVIWIPILVAGGIAGFGILCQRGIIRCG
jgi:hypothetical protein